MEEDNIVPNPPNYFYLSVAFDILCVIIKDPEKPSHIHKRAKMYRWIISLLDLESFFFIDWKKDKILVDLLEEGLEKCPHYGDFNEFRLLLHNYKKFSLL
jgi:hypothetical protein